MIVFCILCFCFASSASVFGFCVSVLHIVILFPTLCFCFVPIGHRKFAKFVQRYFRPVSDYMEKAGLSESKKKIGGNFVFLRDN